MAKRGTVDLEIMAVAPNTCLEGNPNASSDADNAGGRSCPPAGLVGLGEQVPVREAGSEPAETRAEKPSVKITVELAEASWVKASVNPTEARVDEPSAKAPVEPAKPRVDEPPVETGAEPTKARADEYPVEAGADPAHLGRRKSGAKTAADGLGVQSARKPANTKQGQDSGAEGQESSEHGLAPFRAGERIVQHPYSCH